MVFIVLFILEFEWYYLIWGFLGSISYLVGFEFVRVVVVYLV